MYLTEKFAKLVVAAGLTSCATGGGQGEGSAEGSSTLRVTLANHVWTDIIKDKISDLTKKYQPQKAA